MTRYLFPSRVVDNENRGLPTSSEDVARDIFPLAPLCYRFFVAVAALMGVTLSIRDSRLRQWREKLRRWMSWETRLCAPLAHIVGTGRVIDGGARDPSVASSCAKYANVRYVREAETRVVSSRKHPRDSLPLDFANWRVAKEWHVVAQHIPVRTASCTGDVFPLCMVR